MPPGQNCLTCLSFRNAVIMYAPASADSGAGVAGVTVEFTDVSQTVHTYTTNAVGTFLARTAVPLPLQKAAVIRNGQRVEMGGAPAGDCNRCHTLPAAGGAAGRIHTP